MNRALLMLTLAATTACLERSDSPPSVAQATQDVSGSYTLLVPPVFGGSFQVQPAGTPCSANCWTYPSGTAVTVTPVANADAIFTGWTGDCAGQVACTLTMAQDHTLAATFLPAFTLAITPMSGGSVQGGPLIGTTRGLSTTIASGQVITLTPLPDAGATFTGWTGDCSGTGDCVLPMTQSHTVSATFSTSTPPVVLTVTPTAGGIVTSAPTGITCGAACSAAFSSGTVVTLTATPAAGYLFTGWTGACTGTGTCTLVLNQSLGIGATFVAAMHTLTITNYGPGTTRVSTYTCAGTCVYQFATGSALTLTMLGNYLPYVGHPRAQLIDVIGCAWDGSNTCSLTLDQDTTVEVDWDGSNPYL